MILWSIFRGAKAREIKPLKYKQPKQSHSSHHATRHFREYLRDGEASSRVPLNCFPKTKSYESSRPFSKTACTVVLLTCPQTSSTKTTWGTCENSRQTYWIRDSDPAVCADADTFYHLRTSDWKQKDQGLCQREVPSINREIEGERRRRTEEEWRLQRERGRIALIPLELLYMFKINFPGCGLWEAWSPAVSYLPIAMV